MIIYPQKFNNYRIGCLHKESCRKSCPVILYRHIRFQLQYSEFKNRNLIFAEISTN